MMKKRNYSLILLIAGLMACAGPNKTSVNEETEVASVSPEPHRYGGWYCPDNLYGFPAVDIENWQNVPVVNDRLPTEEEARNGMSLILVDTEKYPDAKALDITMPKLARYFCRSTQREELIIVIQAIQVNEDSIVGFRFLNGGNGSAWLDEVDFLSGTEIKTIPTTRFVSQTIQIKAKRDKIWDILTNVEHEGVLHTTFDKENKLDKDWRSKTNVNFFYQNTVETTAAYAAELYGNFYIQNDYTKNGYSEKFLLVEDQETGTTVLKIVCGPFADDFTQQEAVLKNWGEKVKALSEE